MEITGAALKASPHSQPRAHQFCLRDKEADFGIPIFAIEMIEPDEAHDFVSPSATDGEIEAILAMLLAQEILVPFQVRSYFQEGKSPQCG